MSTPAGPFEYILSEQHLATALGVPLSYLEFARAQIALGDAYEYRKKSIHGKARELAVPRQLLMSLQRRILDFLWPLSLSLHPACHGYTPGRSATTNAAPHCGAQWVQRLDVEDFFPSTRPVVITEALVRQGASDAVAALLTDITVDKGGLPLGAPCSPLLSNLVMTSVDDCLAEIASSANIVYTRYADDMTFSADTKFDMTEAARAALHPLGFTLNYTKSRLRRRGQSIAVTGLRIAEADHPRLPKQFKRRLRQEFHFIETYGLSEHCLARYCWHWIDEDDDDKQVEQSTRHLQGKVRYALGVEREWMSALLDAHPRAASELTPPEGNNAGRRLAALKALASDIMSRPQVPLTREATSIGPSRARLPSWPQEAGR